MAGKLPIIDLHCDLLSYLAIVPGADLHNTTAIGAALPYLRSGNVKLQVMAIYTPTKKGSAALAAKQVASYRQLSASPEFHPVVNASEARAVTTGDSSIGITLAIENASGLCEEEEPLDLTFQRLEALLDECQRIFYIGITHHPENRFGGGNYSDNIGLKPDGKRLLDFLHGKTIAVDLAHTSDRLAHDIINYIDAKSLAIPIIASHSNFRTLWNHVRNLPDELVKEVVNRKGLIGMNFLRAYIHPSEPFQLIEHILYGLQKEVASECLAFGADFFYRQAINDPSRIPFFFTEHEDAGKYPEIIEKLQQQGIQNELLQKVAYENVLNFIDRNWG